MISNGAKVNAQTAQEGRTPLVLAATRGHVEIARAVLENGADITLAETQTGNTAAHIACELGEPEVAGLLVTSQSFNYIMSVQNKAGDTAYAIAERKIVVQVEEHLGLATPTNPYQSMQQAALGIQG